MEQLRFTIPEILSLIGIVQCVYIIVYMMFRSGRLSRAGLPMLYFVTLGIAFFADFGEGYIAELTPYYFYIQWTAWFLGPPLSVLLIIQIAQIHKTPAFLHYWVLFLIPLSLIGSSLLVQPELKECQNFLPCADRQEALYILGLIAGAVSLLNIWFIRGIFEQLFKEKEGKTRYWLILAIIITNTFFLLLALVSLGADTDEQLFLLTRNLLGLAFVYLVGTSLFRIYPQAVNLVTRTQEETLNPDEKEIAQKIQNLLKFEKVYQEPTYSRTDLARECDTSETTISRVINVHFKKSFPQLMNEYRVEDAKQLLLQTDANIKLIAEEVGFNSLPSFNRVFKDMAGVTPTTFRQKKA